MSEPKPMPSYWALAEEVTHLHGQLDKLKAENAALRIQLADVTESMGRVEERCAKLRELVGDYHMFEHGDCHSCRYHDECRKDESCRCIAPMRLADRMRELCVEADR